MRLSDRSESGRCPLCLPAEMGMWIGGFNVNDLFYIAKANGFRNQWKEKNPMISQATSQQREYWNKRYRQNEYRQRSLCICKKFDIDDVSAMDDDVSRGDATVKVIVSKKKNDSFEVPRDWNRDISDNLILFRAMRREESDFITTLGLQARNRNGWIYHGDHIQSRHQNGSPFISFSSSLPVSLWYLFQQNYHVSARHLDILDAEVVVVRPSDIRDDVYITNCSFDGDFPKWPCFLCTNDYHNVNRGYIRGPQDPKLCEECRNTIDKALWAHEYLLEPCKGSLGMNQIFKKLSVRQLIQNWYGISSGPNNMKYLCQLSQQHAAKYTSHTYGQLREDSWQSIIGAAFGNGLAYGVIDNQQLQPALDHLTREMNENFLDLLRSQSVNSNSANLNSISTNSSKTVNFELPTLLNVAESESDQNFKSADGLSGGICIATVNMHFGKCKGWNQGRGLINAIMGNGREFPSILVTQETSNYYSNVDQNFENLNPGGFRCELATYDNAQYLGMIFHNSLDDDSDLSGLGAVPESDSKNVIMNGHWQQNGTCHSSESNANFPPASGSESEQTGLSVSQSEYQNQIKIRIIYPENCREADSTNSDSSNLIKPPQHRYAIQRDFNMYGRKLIVVNVHLEGGKFEDQNFQEGTRAKFMKQIVSKQPHIILGDFNGNPCAESSATTLQNYDCYVRNKEAFMRWKSEPFQVLERAGYIRSEQNQYMRRTSRFGDCVDHIYVKKDDIDVTNTSRIELFWPDDLCSDSISDHHLISATIKWKHQTPHINSTSTVDSHNTHVLNHYVTSTDNVTESSPDTDDTHC